MALSVDDIVRIIKVSQGEACTNALILNEKKKKY